MSSFTGELNIIEVEPGRRWKLGQPLRYEVGTKGSGRFIELEMGFETDGATLPAPLRLVLATWGTYGRAACIHDLGYRLIRRGTPHPLMLTRKDVDAEFYIAMRACGTSAVLAWAIWATVRMIGWWYCRTPNK